jgi:hypothetical protein
VNTRIHISCGSDITVRGSLKRPKLGDLFVGKKIFLEQRHCAVGSPKSGLCI